MSIQVLFDFINLTQVHNFTVSAQDIFTFRRLSVFTVSFTGILHETFCTVLLTSQVVMVQSLQQKGREFFYFNFYSIRLTSFIIDVPRPLSNVLWIIIFKRLMRSAYTEPVCQEHLRASKKNSIRNKTPETPISRSVFSIL